MKDEFLTHRKTQRRYCRVSKRYSKALNKIKQMKNQMQMA